MVGMFVCQIYCLGLAVGAQSCVEHDFLRVEPESGTLPSLRVTLKRPSLRVLQLEYGAVLQSVVHMVCSTFLFRTLPNETAQTELTLIPRTR